MIPIVKRTWQTVVGKKGLGLLPYSPEEPRSGARPGIDHVWCADDEGECSSVFRARSGGIVGGSVITLEGYFPPIADQGPEPTCVGEMAHGLLGAVDRIIGYEPDPPSADAAYRQSVAAHTLPGQKMRNSGTYLRVCLSEIKRRGVTPQRLWPRKRIRDPLKQPPAKVRGQGIVYRGLRYEFIRARSFADELDLIDAAIRRKQPVGFAWDVTERFINHTGTAPFDPKPRKSDVVVGGHAECWVSERDENQIVRLRNSWGRFRCDGGYENVRADRLVDDSGRPLIRDAVIISGYERSAK